MHKTPVSTGVFFGLFSLHRLEIAASAMICIQLVHPCGLILYNTVIRVIIV